MGPYLFLLGILCLVGQAIVLERDRETARTLAWSAWGMFAASILVTVFGL